MQASVLLDVKTNINVFTKESRVASSFQHLNMTFCLLSKEVAVTASVTLTSSHCNEGDNRKRNS